MSFKVPEVDHECLRCKCEPGAATPCATQETCSCHWSEEVREAIAADEELATRKEESK